MMKFVYVWNAVFCLANLAFFIAQGSPLNFLVAMLCGITWAMEYADRRASTLILQHSERP